jgi:hypothetical protein
MRRGMREKLKLKKSGRLKIKNYNAGFLYIKN